MLHLQCVVCLVLFFVVGGVGVGVCVCVGLFRSVLVCHVGLDLLPSVASYFVVRCNALHEVGCDLL